MPCYHPVKGYQCDSIRTQNGKLRLVFDRKLVANHAFTEIQVPCGKCIGCRLEKSRQWALRCVHEASMFDYNCFITLTFNDENLSPDGSLNKVDFRNFMKRLRKAHSGKQYIGYGGRRRRPIRYFHCGEYGSQLGRPHHHACIFNFDFEDKVLWKEQDGIKLYRSAELEKLWPFGYCTIGDVTFESAAYVARYVCKKIGGEAAAKHYMRIDEQTGEVYYLQPEYGSMSRRPGIGYQFFKKFKTDCYPKDFITHNGIKQRVPKYYDRIMEQDDEEAMKKVKMIRRIKRNIEENTLMRLSVKERVKRAQIKTLKRSYEE